MHKAPRIILSIIVIVALGWGAFWFVAAQTTERVLSGWFADREAEGWSVAYDALDTQGFPNRLDTTITNLAVSDPGTGIAWSAPLFQNLSLVYRPTQVIAVFPGEQTFATRDEVHHVTAESFRASAQLRAEIELPVTRSVVEIDAAEIRTEDGNDTRLDHAVIAMREAPGQVGDVYEFDVNAEGIGLDPRLVGRLNDSGALPDKIERLHASATITFDAPFDRYAIERARPQPREIDLSDITAQWGPLEFRASGQLQVDVAGTPEGVLDVSARNWREMIEVARATGALPDQLLGALSAAGQMIARMSGSPETLDTVLRFEGGRMFLGPVPIGPAPVVSIP